MQNTLNKKGLQSSKSLDKQSSNKENVGDKLNCIKQEVPEDNWATLSRRHQETALQKARQEA